VIRTEGVLVLELGSHCRWNMGCVDWGKGVWRVGLSVFIAGGGLVERKTYGERIMVARLDSTNAAGQRLPCMANISHHVTLGPASPSP